jgi:hypothetical protein
MSFLDVPQAVLLHVLAPLLDKNARLALNEALPARRVWTKFHAGHADAHHMRLCSEKWFSMLRRIEASEDRALRRNRVLRLVQDLARPMHALFIQHNADFRNVAVAKITELMASPPLDVSFRWWQMFRRQCERTLAVHMQ